MPTKRPTTTIIIDPPLRRAIDAARGFEPLGSFIRRTLRRVLKADDSRARAK